MKHFIFLIVAVYMTVTAGGQTIQGGDYIFGNTASPFVGVNGNVPSFPYIGPALTGITASALTKVGVTTSSSSFNSRASNWPTGAVTGSNTFTGTIGATKYFEFTLTAATGNLPSIQVRFGLGRSGAGPRQWAWRSSVDSYATNITCNLLNAGATESGGIITVPDADANWLDNVFQLTPSSSAAVTFRLYGFNAEGTGGTGGLQGPLEFFVTTSGSSPSMDIPSTHVYEVFPGETLDVTNFTNAGTVNLNASTTAYSQLKISGTATAIGNGTTTGIIKQFQYLEDGSHLLSSPVTQGFGTTSGTSAQLYSYNASVGNWAAIGANFATAGLGFAARVDGSQIPFLTAAANASVTGTPNTSMTHTLGYYALNSQAGGSGAGWNLIGNPYTCGLDWSTVSLTNVNSAFYIWDPGNGTVNGSYKYYSAGGISDPVIPPMQAFWVQATQAGASIVTEMATNGTVSSSPAYFKTIHDNLIVTVTKVGDSATTDRLWVANILGTSDGFDGAYDAWKMTNGPAMPNVFTWDLGERIAINATQIDAAKVLPMGFSYAVAGEKFGVSLEQITGGQYYDVYLEDKLTGSYHDLNQSDYPFTHQGWTQEDPRFALHFSLSTVGVEEPNAADLFVAYQNQDRIMLRSSGEGFSAYRLYGLNGQELSSGPLTQGMQSIAAPTSAGLYFIEAHGPQGSLRQKIIIVN